MKTYYCSNCLEEYDFDDFLPPATPSMCCNYLLVHVPDPIDEEADGENGYPDVEEEYPRRESLWGDPDEAGGALRRVRVAMFVIPLIIVCLVFFWAIK